MSEITLMWDSAGPGAAPDLFGGLRAVGIGEGDIVFVQLSAAASALGGTDGDSGQAAHAVLEQLRRAVGATGTLVVPTYTFSFCRGEPFDPDSTPAVAGPWQPWVELAEVFRRQPGTLRSRDPIHSVAAAGPAAATLVQNVAPTCFGPGSLFERLKLLGAKLCLIGLPLEEATFRHHTEEMVEVPFRYKKLFTGTIVEQGRATKQGWLYSVRILAENGTPDGSRLERRARQAGVCRAAVVGPVHVLGLDARAYDGLTRRELAREPWLTARGPAGDPARLEAARVGAPPIEVELPLGASMQQMVERLWRLPRDIVSDGYDAALHALTTQVPMTIHEYPAGRECWSWIVPERWTCHEAYLETLDGRRLFSYADHPLHVVSYSLPFEGEVDHATLMRHLHVHPTLPDAVPFIFKYYERDWGLCCTREMRDRLTDARYRVVIRTSFSYGTLKVGEVVVPGRSADAFVLCAHLCHPAMVNDDLTGVVVGIDVMRALLRGPTPRLSYRLLIVPETIGSIAYLSHHASLIPRLCGGLFLEMLGREHPHVLQHSFAETSEIDRCLVYTLRHHAPGGWVAPFRALMGNDERQFNAPGVRVPMLMLSRQLRPADPDFPFREYHSSADVPALVPPGALEESRDLVLRMLATLDANAVPANVYPGEVFCSRFGIHVDPYTNPAGNRALFDILFLIDGTRSIREIAEACGISFEAARHTVDELGRQGVVTIP